MDATSNTKIYQNDQSALSKKAVLFSISEDIVWDNKYVVEDKWGFDLGGGKSAWCKTDNLHGRVLSNVRVVDKVSGQAS